MRTWLGVGMVGMVVVVGGCNGAAIVEGTETDEGSGTGTPSTSTSTAPTTGAAGTSTGSSTDASGGLTGGATTGGPTEATTTTAPVTATEATGDETGPGSTSTADATGTTGTTSTTSTTGTTGTTMDTTSGETSTGEPAPVCGDSVQGPGEACDDGDDDNSDECTNACKVAVCGDGVVQAGVDECDDSNAVNTDACSNKCVVTPTGVTLAAGMNTAQGGSPQNGTVYNDACGDGRALVGFEGVLDGYHHKIRGVCGLLAVTPQNGGFAVAAGDPVTLPERGMFGTMAWTRTCPQDQVMVGFSGRGGLLVDALTFTCAPLVVSEAGDGAWTIAVGAAADLAKIGGNGGQPFAQANCPMGQIATMQRLRAGDGIDAFGLGCSVVGLEF